MKARPIHTILSTDADGREYHVPFLHDKNDREYVGYLCKGCNKSFGFETSVEDKVPALLGYQWSEKMNYWEKVEYCKSCVQRLGGAK